MNKKLKKILLSLLIGIAMLATTSNLSKKSIEAAENVPVNLGNIQGTNATVKQGLYTAWWNNGIGKISVNGEIAFCIEPMVLGLGGTYSKSEDIPKEEQLRLSMIVYYGWDSTAKSDIDYATTQFMIWEAIGVNVTFTGTFGSQYPSLKSQVQSKIDNHNAITSFNGTSNIVNLGESLTLNDANGVLSQFHIKDTGGLDIQIQGNNLVITPNINTPSSTSIVLQKILDKNVGASIAYRSSADDGQDVGIFKLSDPQRNTLNITVNKYVDVTLSKEDIQTGKTPQGNASLIGAEYSLFKADGTFIEKKNIGTDLTLKFNQLMASDEYYIQETKAPTGYLLNGEKIVIKPLELLSNGAVGADLQYSVISKETIAKQAVEGYKFNTDGNSGVATPLKDVEFTLKLKSDVDSVGWDNAKTYTSATTNAKGYFKTSEIPYGTYILKETKTPHNYIAINDVVVNVGTDSREPLFFYFNNAAIKQYLRIEKLDQATGKNVTLNSATFEIYTEDGTQYKEKDGTKYKTSFNTDENGILELNEALNPGSYFAVETSSLPGFLAPAEKYEFKVDQDNKIIGFNEVDGIPIIQIKIYNERPTATLKLTKTFEKDDTVQNKEAKFMLNNGFMTVVSPVDGSVIYKPFEQILNPNSEDGLWSVKDKETLSIDGLQFGTDNQLNLVLKEVSTNKEYKLDETVHNITIKKTDDTTKVYEYAVDVENKLYHPSIGTKATGINGEKSLDPTIENTLIDVSSVEDMNPNVLNTIRTRLWKYSEDGNHEMIAERIYKDITFSEVDKEFTSEILVQANELSEGRYFFTEEFFDQDKPEDPEKPYMEHNDPEDPGQTIKFEKKEYTIKLAKRDAATKEIIANLKYTFEAKFIKDGEIVDTQQFEGNTDTGWATLTFTGAGSYDALEIREIDAPKGYLLSDEVKVVKMADFDENNVYAFDYFNQMMPVVVKSGDNTNQNALIALMIIGLGGILIVSLSKKKQSKEK